MRKSLLTVDDVVATLSHSSLPSIVVEGGSDAVVLRRLEEVVSNNEISVLPVGGRDTVLGVFARRLELENAKCILFIADKDFWVYTGVPAQYISEDILFTEGYSIENDMYSDGRLERLLTDKEREDFFADLDFFIDWFANQVRNTLDGLEAQISIHPNQIFQMPRADPQDVVLRATISGGYMALVRGKSLFAIILRQLSRAGRVSKYSYDNLLELGATESGPNLVRIREWIATRLISTGCRELN